MKCNILTNYSKPVITFPFCITRTPYTSLTVACWCFLCRIVLNQIKPVGLLNAWNRRQSRRNIYRGTFQQKRFWGIHEQNINSPEDLKLPDLCTFIDNRNRLKICMTQRFVKCTKGLHTVGQHFQYYLSQFCSRLPVVNRLLDPQGTLLNSWKAVWVVLSEDGVEFYKKKTDSSPKGMIPLKGATLISPCQDFGKRMVRKCLV